jgi:hypothetical protein
MGRFASGKLPTDRWNNAESVKYTAGNPFWTDWPWAVVVDGTPLKDLGEIPRTGLFLAFLYTQTRSYLAGKISVLCYKLCVTEPHTADRGNTGVGAYRIFSSGVDMWSRSSATVGQTV